MSDIKFLSGTATNVSMISTTSGYFQKGTGSVSTAHTFTFRVDNKPIKYSGLLNLSDGDEVKVAGFNKGGELDAIALKNITTCAGYSKPNKTLGVALIIVGVLLCITVFATPFGIIATIFGRTAIRNKQILDAISEPEPDNVIFSRLEKLVKKKYTTAFVLVFPIISASIFVITAINRGEEMARETQELTNQGLTPAEQGAQRRLEQASPNSTPEEFYPSRREYSTPPGMDNYFTRKIPKKQ